MSTITKPNTFSSGATIFASEHNDNFDTIFNDYNGNITNINIASGAAISDTKLDLASVAQAVTINGDFQTTEGTTIGNATGDALTYHPSAWTLTNAVSITGTWTDLGTVTTMTLGGATMSLGSDADGDTYHRASNVLTRLPKGTAAQVLTMNSGATVPEWADGGTTNISSGTFSLPASSSTLTNIFTHTALDESLYKLYIRLEVTSGSGTASLRMHFNDDSSGNNYNTRAWTLLGTDTTLVNEASATADSIKLFGESGANAPSGDSDTNITIEATISIHNSDTYISWELRTTRADITSTALVHGIANYDAGTMTSFEMGSNDSQAVFTGTFKLLRIF